MPAQLQSQPIDKEKIMTGQIRQFSNIDSIKKLLSKIMDYKITKDEIQKEGNKIIIEVNTDKTNAIYIQHRLHQAGIERPFAQSHTLKFADNQTTVEDLQNKMAKGMAMRLVDDINGNLSAYDESPMKEALSKFTLQAVKDAIINPETAQNRDNPVVRRFVNEFNKYFKGTDESVKKIYAQRILKDAAIGLKIQPDKSLELS
mgnify:CR=1 FL=1